MFKKVHFYLNNFSELRSLSIFSIEFQKKKKCYLCFAFIATREYYSKMIAELPESIDELNTFGDTVTEDIEFIEVPTSSPRFADSISLPVFVVTGFLTKKMRKMYANLIYPAFEARLPETIDSIEQVAKILVQVNIIIILFFINVFRLCNFIVLFIYKPLSKYLFTETQIYHQMRSCFSNRCILGWCCVFVDSTTVRSRKHCSELNTIGRYTKCTTRLDEKSATVWKY